MYIPHVILTSEGWNACKFCSYLYQEINVQKLPRGHLDEIKQKLKQVHKL